MISFASDVLPMFRPKDFNCMGNFGVLLNEYGYMSDVTGNETYADHANARSVLDHVSETAVQRMPLGGPYWTADHIQTLRNWIEAGCPP